MTHSYSLENDGAIVEDAKEEIPSFVSDFSYPTMPRIIVTSCHPIHDFGENFGDNLSTEPEDAGRRSLACHRKRKSSVNVKRSVQLNVLW